MQVARLFFVFVLFFYFFIFSQLSNLPPIQNAYPRANKQRMPTLERPTLERNAYILARHLTLELPWRRTPTWEQIAYPGATLERHPAYIKRLPCSGLPWSEIAYPGPTLERHTLDPPTLDLPWSRNARPAAAPG